MRLGDLGGQPWSFREKERERERERERFLENWVYLSKKKKKLSRYCYA